MIIKHILLYFIEYKNRYKMITSEATPYKIIFKNNNFDS